MTAPPVPSATPAALEIATKALEVVRDGYDHRPPFAKLSAVAEQGAERAREALDRISLAAASTEAGSPYLNTPPHSREAAAREAVSKLLQDIESGHFKASQGVTLAVIRIATLLASSTTAPVCTEKNDG